MDGLVKRFFQALPLVLLSLMSASANETVSSFQQALEQTEKIQSPARGSCTEQAGIRRFEDFLAHLDEKTARDETERVYAPDAYLNDTLKTIHGAPAIRDYFIKTAKGLDSMTVIFDDLAVLGRNYYFRWTMDTRMKNLARGKTVRTIGITLVRFDSEGRVTLHQDFWDSSQGVWEHVPVMGSVIRWIRTKI
jgi:limonene-1,2-epoxide hydrolase